MSQINAKTIVLVIQLVQKELMDIQKIPQEKMTEGDEIHHYECQRAAMNLKEVYLELEKDTLNYPPYAKLAPEDL
jgi:hypothetical protein